MIEITRDFIAMISPNANAVKNGKSLAESGAFWGKGIDKEKTVIFSHCKGSGSSVYRCSVDFISGQPVFKCNCPSRQIPCKHCVGLLTDYMLNADFFVEMELPTDIRESREKKETLKKKSSKRTSTTLSSSAKKKLEKQLEGLDLASQFVKETMEKGVASLMSGSLATYESFAKELGNYYLLGIQSTIWEMLDIIRQSKNSQEVAYQLVNTMVELQQQIVQCRTYLETQIQENRAMPAFETSYEYLGNIWKTEQLKELGAVKENVTLVQLHFSVKEDNVQKRFEDIGYYMVLETKEIVKTVNIVPFKSVKHISRDDSIHNVIEVGTLITYPANKNPRVRMEDIKMRDGFSDDWKAVINGAISMSDALKEVKNQFKNPLSDESMVFVVFVDDCVKKENQLMFVGEKDSVPLRIGEGNYIERYSHIQYKDCKYDLRKGVFTLQFVHDEKENQIYAIPLSLVTESGIIRF